MRHVYNDGGRKAAGYKGDAGDCVARAIAIASGTGGKVESRLGGFLGRGRPGPVATPARNILISGCIYERFSQFREGLRPNLLKVGRVKFSRNQVARGKI